LVFNKELKMVAVHRISMLVLVTAGLVACAAKPGSAEFVQKKEEEQQKEAVKAVTQTISKAPVWYTQPPMDVNAIYVTATELSSDMQMAMDTSVLSAKRTLAGQLGDRVSSKMTDFASQTGVGGDTQVIKEIERVTKSVATDINVAGYVREKSELVQEGTKYRAFVLLRYPVGESNKVIADQVKKSAVLEAKVRASKAFQDLEHEIEVAKKK
jgi:hypothetical protein